MCRYFLALTILLLRASAVQLSLPVAVCKHVTPFQRAHDLGLLGLFRDRPSCASPRRTRAPPSSQSMSSPLQFRGRPLAPDRLETTLWPAHAECSTVLTIDNCFCG